MISSSAFAEDDNYSLLIKTIDIFSDLDSKWRQLDSEMTRANLKRFRNILPGYINEFKSLKECINPNLNKPFSDYSKTFSDVIEEIDSTLKRDEKLSIESVRLKLSYITQVSLELAMGLLDDENNNQLMLSRWESSKILKHIDNKFGLKITGKNAVNGDTPFAQSVSIFNEFIKKHSSPRSGAPPAR
jgi:hypothetical protein